MSQFTRRTALTGMGVTVGLPWLESLGRAMGEAAIPAG